VRDATRCDLRREEQVLIDVSSTLAQSGCVTSFVDHDAHTDTRPGRGRNTGPPGTPLSPGRLLVVEDDEGFAALMQRLLTREGYLVDVADNGTDALAAGLENTHDAILLDVMLPGLDGFSVVRHLREAQVNVPVVMMSARDAVADRVNGLRSGADDYLTKPFPMAELLARLELHLRRSLVTRTLASRVDASPSDAS
jgi:CheY-like chemotaxis protein